MPSLDEATQPIDRTRLSALPAPPAAPVAVYAGAQYPANPNPFLRCPIPPVAATPDNLRQYYQGGLIPQFRIMTPASLSQSTVGGATSAGSSTVISSSSSSTTVVTKIGTVQTAAITTPVLNPGQTYQTTLSTSSTFVPLTISVNNAARIELYATNSAQIVDQTRANTTSPGPATQQGILLDVTLNTSPLTWLVTPSLPASNGDSPQKSLSYITVTNEGVASVAITASLQYLILEL